MWLAIVILGVLPVAAGLFAGTWRLLGNRRDATATVERTLQAMRRLSALEADIERTISDGRGFVLSRNPEDQASSDAALARIDRDFESLRALMADDPGRQAALARLQPLVMARIAVLHDIMRTVIGGDLAGRVPDATLRPALMAMDQVLEAFSRFEAEEKNLLRERQTIADHADQLATLALGVGSAIIIAGLLLICGLILQNALDKSIP